MSNLAKMMIIVPSFCYLCDAQYPQFVGRLTDSRKVWYCGNCWKSLQECLKIWRDRK